MNELEFAGTMPDFGVSFVQASSDATRRFCEQGQSVAKTIGEWNTEVRPLFQPPRRSEWRDTGAHDEVPDLRRSLPFKRYGFEKLRTTT